MLLCATYLVTRVGPLKSIRVTAYSSLIGCWWFELSIAAGVGRIRRLFSALAEHSALGGAGRPVATLLNAAADVTALRVLVVVWLAGLCLWSWWHHFDPLLDTRSRLQRIEAMLQSGDRRKSPVGNEEANTSAGGRVWRLLTCGRVRQQPAEAETACKAWNSMSSDDEEYVPCESKSTDFHARSLHGSDESDCDSDHSESDSTTSTASAPSGASGEGLRAASDELWLNSAPMSPYRGFVRMMRRSIEGGGGRVQGALKLEPVEMGEVDELLQGVNGVTPRSSKRGSVLRVRAGSAGEVTAESPHEFAAAVHAGWLKTRLGVRDRVAPM